MTLNLLMYDRLISVISTEKAFNDAEIRKYHFNVHKSSNKDGVKNAVENVFGVEVLKVNIMNVKGKVKRFKRIKGKRNDMKKAIVTLCKGQTINYDMVG